MKQYNSIKVIGLAIALLLLSFLMPATLNAASFDIGLASEVRFGANAKTALLGANARFQTDTKVVFFVDGFFGASNNARIMGSDGKWAEGKDSGLKKTPLGTSASIGIGMDSKGRSTSFGWDAYLRADALWLSFGKGGADISSTGVSFSIGGSMYFSKILAATAGGTALALSCRIGSYKELVAWQRISKGEEGNAFSIADTGYGITSSVSLKLHI